MVRNSTYKVGLKEWGTKNPPLYDKWDFQNSKEYNDTLDGTFRRA